MKIITEDTFNLGSEEEEGEDTPEEILKEVVTIREEISEEEEYL